MTMTSHKYPQKVLLAVDGSEYSEAAVSFLSSLPLSFECTVVCLSVIAPLRQHQRPVLEAALEKASSKLRETVQNVNVELRQGYPASEVIDYADQNQIDLIVVGAKGLRNTINIPLGGVAQQVVEFARCPILIVRRTVNRLRQVGLAVDGSVQSTRATDYLSGFSLPPRAFVRVCHVLPPPPLDEFIRETGFLGSYMNVTINWDEIVEQSARQMQREEKAGKKLLNNTLTQLRDSEVRASKVLLQGDAATELLKYTDENEIDLLVAGSRGLSPIKSWLLGSVSRNLVYHARCSVMVVKGKI